MPSQPRSHPRPTTHTARLRRLGKGQAHKAAHGRWVTPCLSWCDDGVVRKASQGWTTPEPFWRAASARRAFSAFCPCSIVLVHVRTPRGFCSCSLIVFRPCPCARRDVHVGGRRGPGHGLRGARCGFWCASLPHLPSAVELCSQFANRAIVVSAAISPCISLYLATARYISLTTAEIIL